MGECAQASQPPLPAYSLQAIHGLPFEQAALAAWAHAPLAAELRKKRWLRQLGPAIVPLAIRIGVWSYVPMQNNWFDHGIQSERSGGLILTRHRDISGWTMVTLQKTLTVFLEDH